MKSNVIRLISLLMVVAMLAAMPVVAFATPGVDLGHSHNDWTVEDDEDPCCDDEDDGYGTYTGYVTRTCNVCGYEEEEVLGSHQFHAYVLEDADDDYVEGEDGTIGYWVLTCDRCEDEIEVYDHNNAGAHGDYKLGHYLDTYVQNPTCVNYGYKIQRCTSPGCEYETNYVVLNPTGHTWVKDEGGNEWKVVREATSTRQGLKQRTCKVCGAVDTCPIAWVAPSYDIATISADSTMLYKESSTSSTILSVALRGSRFKVLSKTADGKWIQIENPDDSSKLWVPAANVQLGSSNKTASAYAGAIKYSTVAEASGAKVHSAADAASATGASVSKYTPVYIYEQKSGFSRIERNSNKWLKDDELGTVYNIRLGLDGTSDVNSPTYTAPEKMEDESNTNATATVVATGYVTSNTPLNVRSSAEISVRNLIGSLAKGTKVEITKTKKVNGHDWGCITYKGKTGWICLDYVNVTPVSTAETTVSASGSVLNATIVNCATGARVRKTPDATDPTNILGTAPVGTRVAITEFDVVGGKRWGYADKKGWICMDYVKLDAGAEDAIKGTSGTGETALTTYTNVSVPAYVKSAADMYKKAEAVASEKLMTISADASKVITVTDRSYDGTTTWCKVTVGSVSGWVDQSKLELPAVVAVVSTTTTNVYSEKNIDSKVDRVLGKDSVVTIAKNEQTTDGVFVWGKLDGTTTYVRMDQLSNIKDASEASNIVKTVSIPATVLKSTVMYKTSDLTTDILTLEKDRTVTIIDLVKNSAGKYVAKATVGSYTGWFEIAPAATLTDSTTWNVKQDVIKGSVYADAVNAYSEPSTSSTKELVLRKGQNINIVMRVAVDRNVWGLYKLNGKFYWSNLQGVTLAGEAAPAGTTTTTTTTTAATTTTTASGTAAGTIVCAKSVNVRKAAGVSNALVTTLANGTKVTVYEQTTVDNAVWGRIDQGWVAMAYVDLSTKTTGTTAATTTGTILSTVPSGSVAVGFVNTTDLAVRSGAGQGYTKVTTLAKGTNVVIHEQQLVGGMIWGRIDQGWICTSYVTLTGIGNSSAGTTGLVKGCFYTANVRSAPGVGNALVGKVMVNSSVVIYEQQEYSGEMWGRTDIGWIAMQYVLIGSIPTV